MTYTNYLLFDINCCTVQTEYNSIKWSDIGNNDNHDDHHHLVCKDRTIIGYACYPILFHFDMKDR